MQYIAHFASIQVSSQHCVPLAMLVLHWLQKCKKWFKVRSPQQSIPTNVQLSFNSCFIALRLAQQHGDQQTSSQGQSIWSKSKALSTGQDPVSIGKHIVSGQLCQLCSTSCLTTKWTRVKLRPRDKEGSGHKAFKKSWKIQNIWIFISHSWISKESVWCFVLFYEPCAWVVWQGLEFDSKVKDLQFVFPQDILRN